MPRPNKGRTLFAEENLAQRVAIERGRRGWSYEGLAERMTQVGCRIAPSALYKIEKGSPPRRVTVDEVVAFSRVFGISMASLVADPRLAKRDHLAGLAEEALNVSHSMYLLSREFDDSEAALGELWREMDAQLAADPELAELVLSAFDEKVPPMWAMDDPELASFADDVRRRITGLIAGKEAPNE